MAKTNFTKVEEALEQGLRKMSVEQLFEATESKKSQAAVPTDKEKTPETPLTKAQTRLITSLQRDLKRLQIKEHRAIFTELGMTKVELKQKIGTPTQLTPEEWEQIKQIKDKINKYKQELQAKLPLDSNDQLIEEERVKHKNKRFNVNDGWLPLH